MAKTRERVRVLTINLWATGAAWPERCHALSRGIERLDPDLIAIQEAVKTDARDDVREIVNGSMHVHYQAQGVPPGGDRIAIASRWPLVAVDEIGQQLNSRIPDFPATALIAEIAAPAAIGRLVFANQVLGWQAKHQRARELQAVAVAALLDTVAIERSGQVILAGDFDSTPENATMRFLTGRQSLEEASACYRDAWEAMHPGEPGHTFTAKNPHVAGNTALSQVIDRRIDYVLVRADERGPSLPIESCQLAFSEPLDDVWASDHFGVVADLAAGSRSDAS